MKRRGDGQPDQRLLTAPRFDDRPRVRIVVWLDAQAVDDLADIIAFRRGRQSRSAVVREAVTWLLAKQAAWLLRERAANDRRRCEAELKAAAASLAERERAAIDISVAQALRVAREDA